MLGFIPQGFDVHISDRIRLSPSIFSERENSQCRTMRVTKHLPGIFPATHIPAQYVVSLEYLMIVIREPSLRGVIPRHLGLDSGRCACSNVLTSNERTSRQHILVFHSDFVGWRRSVSAFGVTCFMLHGCCGAPDDSNERTTTGRNRQCRLLSMYSAAFR